MVKSDLFDWVPEVIQWFGDTFGWVADIVSWVGDAIAWLGSRIAWIWQVDFPISPGARAVAVVTVAAIGAGIAIRRLRLSWLARSPRVQITPFAWTGPSETDREAIWITSLFREQLAALRLQAHDALPGRASGDPLVDIVEGVAQGVGQKADIGKAFARLLRAIWPGAAYEAWGTLQPLGERRGRISVQLVDGSGRVLTSVAPDEAGWEAGARQAAMAVAGALYPRLGMRHRGPWTRWREPLSRELVSAYFEATEHERKNRLEEAMGAYHVALRHDPLNPHLRLRIAMLQERLALYLDAWVTYRAIVDEERREAWKGADRKVRLIALYRLAILLGNGKMAAQWMRHDALTEREETQRDRERDELRIELRMALERDELLVGRAASSSLIANSHGIARASSRQLLNALCDSVEDDGAGWVASLLKPFSAAGPKETPGRRKERVEWIGDVLQIASLRRLEELDMWLRLVPLRSPVRKGWGQHRPPPRSVLRRQELSRSAVRVSIRLARIRIAANSERRRSDVKAIQDEHVKLTSSWPFPPRGLHRRLAHFARPKQRLANGRDDAWQLHYNAACVAASVLLDGSVLRNAQTNAAEVGNLRERLGRVLPDSTDEDEIVHRAVRELEEFARRAGSNQVAALADWVAIDDPDLEGLSRRPEFKLWASHHLPRGLPKERAHRSIDVNRHTARVLHRGARAFARSWRRRADEDYVPTELVATWWRDERDAWRRVWEVCRERRSWKLRLDGLVALRAWQEANLGEPIDFGHEPRGDTAASPKMTEGLLDEIAALVDGEASEPEPGGPTVLRWVDHHAEAVRGAHEQRVNEGSPGPLSPQAVSDEALRAARIWHRLADVLNAELNGESDEARLEDRLEAIRRELADGGT